MQIDTTLPTSIVSSKTSDGKKPKTIKQQGHEQFLRCLHDRFKNLIPTSDHDENDGDGAGSHLSPLDAIKADNNLMLASYKTDMAKTLARFNTNIASLSIAGIGGDAQPQRGLGPTVYIGFDAEWEYLSPGKNRLLSVQFQLVGPGYEWLPKVIHFRGQNAQERPRLADALYELLEEALDLGVIEDWPGDVFLVGFFTRGDITVFSDFRKMRPQLDGVGGTMASVKGDLDLELPMKPERVDQLKWNYSYVVGDTYDPKHLSLRLIDASRLAPVGYSLKDIGTLLGLEKVEIPFPYSIERMSEFQRKDVKGFEEYGLIDAKIAVEYVLFVLWMSKTQLGLDGLSATAGGLAVKMAELCMRKDGADVDQALNFKNVSGITKYSKEGKRYTQKAIRCPTDARRWCGDFLADTYLGGRNECFIFGGTAVSRFYDHDLAGAYVTGLAYMKALDYSRVKLTTDLNDYIGHVAGFAQAEFSFPEETRFPCMPVSAENRGIYFPLNGVSLCTAPEIELAVKMGCTVKILYGLVIPWKKRSDLFALPDGQDDEEGYRPFLSFTRAIRRLRKKFPKKTLLNEFVKLIGNSLYGKTGQGLKQKKAFGVRELDSVLIGPSRITDPACASLVCGFVRAVLGELLWKMPETATVVSVTTDGFLVDLPLKDLDLSGDICQRFIEICEMVTPGSAMLECKHQVQQIVAMRIRGQLTGERDGDHPIVLAKTSVKPPRGTRDPNTYMIDLFLNRLPGQKTSQSSMISMRDQILKGYDIQMQESEVTLNLEFDFKRCPINPRMQIIRGVSHLAFDTKPWKHADDGVLARTIFDDWRRTGCLKTMADWDSWQARYQLSIGNKKRGEKNKNLAQPSGSDDGVRGGGGRVNRTKDGYVGVARRTFLAAYVRQSWGLTREMTGPKLASWLTGLGYKTTVNDVKNAGRSVLNENVVPSCEAVTIFLQLMKDRFPALEVAKFIFAGEI